MPETNVKNTIFSRPNVPTCSECFQIVRGFHITNQESYINKNLVGWRSQGKVVVWLMPSQITCFQFMKYLQRIFQTLPGNHELIQSYDASFNNVTLSKFIERLSSYKLCSVSLYQIQGKKWILHVEKWNMFFPKYLIILMIKPIV